MVSAENWCVQASGRVYGPYPFNDLQRFAAEGRLAPASLIAPAGSLEWMEANEEPRLVPVFETLKAHRKRKASQADTQDARTASTAAPPTVQKPGRAHQSKQQSSTSNFVVIFDVVSGAAGRLESIIRGIGEAFWITENVWSISCRLTKAGITNALTPYLKPSESIFFVDLSHGGAVLKNIGAQKHAEIASAYRMAAR
ncbi:MAG: DUF4339 domain-containing protein [Pseudomonadota bacterium]